MTWCHSLAGSCTPAYALHVQFVTSESKPAPYSMASSSAQAALLPPVSKWRTTSIWKHYYQCVNRPAPCAHGSRHKSRQAEVLQELHLRLKRTQTHCILLCIYALRLGSRRALLVLASGESASLIPAPRQPRLKQAARTTVKVWRHCVQHEPLLLATLFGVATGVVLGIALSFASLSATAIEILGLPGDLLMRCLKMLVLPLITASVAAGDSAC